MEGSLKRQKTKHGSVGRSFGLLLLACLCLALFCLPRLWQQAARSRLAEEIHRALSAAYAASGAYPQSLSELEEYGLMVDEGRYLVRYTPLGENQRPDVEVFIRGQQP